MVAKSTHVFATRDEGGSGCGMFLEVLAAPYVHEDDVEEHAQH